MTKKYFKTSFEGKFTCTSESDLENDRTFSPSWELYISFKNSLKKYEFIRLLWSMITFTTYQIHYK